MHSRAGAEPGWNGVVVKAAAKIGGNSCRPPLNPTLVLDIILALPEPGRRGREKTAQVPATAAVDKGSEGTRIQVLLATAGRSRTAI